MGLGHSSVVVARARELGEAGFKPGRIAALLAKEMNVSVSEVTVRRWVDPDYAERQNAARRSGGSPSRRWGWKSRLRRIRDLRDAGLEYGVIAKVMLVDFDLRLSTQQTRRLSRGEFDDVTTRRLLGAGS